MSNISRINKIYKAINSNKHKEIMPKTRPVMAKPFPEYCSGFDLIFLLLFAAKTIAKTPNTSSTNRLSNSPPPDAAIAKIKNIDAKIPAKKEAMPRDVFCLSLASLFLA